MKSDPFSSQKNSYSNGNGSLPKWFMVIMSGAISLLTVCGIPWATWTTRTLLRVEYQTEYYTNNSARIDRLASELRDLERRMDRAGMAARHKGE